MIISIKRLNFDTAIFFTFCITLDLNIKNLHTAFCYKYYKYDTLWLYIIYRYLIERDISIDENKLLSDIIFSQGKIISEIGNSQIIFTLLMDKIQIEYFIGYLYTVCTNMSRVTVRIV